MANSDGTRGDPLPNVAGGEGVDVPLTAGKFMPGLVEGLIGAKVTPAPSSVRAMPYPLSSRPRSRRPMQAPFPCGPI